MSKISLQIAEDALRKGGIARIRLERAIERFNSSRDREMLDGTVSAGEMSPGKMGERAITHRLAVHLECELTKLRRIPHHKVGHFVYFDPTEVALHIRTKLKIPARG